MQFTQAVCVVCGSTFLYVRGGPKPRQICSADCKRARKNSARALGLKGPTTTVCNNCGRRFEYVRRSRERLYCGPACKASSQPYQPRAVQVTIECLNCGRTFDHIRVPGPPPRICSPECRNARKQAVALAYYQMDAVQKRAATRAWYQANTERAKENARQWVRDNPERARVKRIAATARRRARAAALPSIPFTSAQLQQRLSMWRGCWVCGGEAGCVDHVKPIAAGGSHILANLRPICTPCNSRKRHRWPLTGQDIEAIAARRVA